MTDIADVIGWKFENQPGMTTRDGAIIDFPGGIPSQADQDAWAVEYDAHMASIAYRQTREKAYGGIGDQLDMQYHDLVDGTTTWRDHVAAVKAANPKP
jgi:hypothetical protein